MNLMRKQRWTMAFADLSLLLLGFMALLNWHPEAQKNRSPESDYQPYIKAHIVHSEDIFEAGEAMISEAGKSRIAEIVIGLNGRPITLGISGSGNGSSRLDNWELSAARLASIARYLKQNDHSDVTIDFDGSRLVAKNARQQITIKVAAPKR